MRNSATTLPREPGSGLVATSHPVDPRGRAGVAWRSDSNSQPHDPKTANITHQAIHQPPATASHRSGANRALTRLNTAVLRIIRNLSDFFCKFPLPELPDGRRRLTLTTPGKHLSRTGWAMAGWSRAISRETQKAVRCCQPDGLAGIAYSFIVTAITPVNTADAGAYERVNFSISRGPQTLPDGSSLRPGRRVNGLQRSLITT